MASIAEANDWWRVGGRGIASLRTPDARFPSGNKVGVG